jgi:hypothetical protein
MVIRVNIGRNTSWDKRNGMVMVIARGGKALGSLENSVVLGKDILKVSVHRGVLTA